MATTVFDKQEIIEIINRIDSRLEALEKKLDQFMTEVRRNNFDECFVGHEPFG